MERYHTIFLNYIYFIICIFENALETSRQSKYLAQKNHTLLDTFGNVRKVSYKHCWRYIINNVHVQNN